MRRIGGASLVHLEHWSPPLLRRQPRSVTLGRGLPTSFRTYVQAEQDKDLEALCLEAGPSQLSSPNRSRITIPRSDTSGSLSSSRGVGAAGRCTSSGSSSLGWSLPWRRRSSSSRFLICSIMKGGNMGRSFLSRPPLRYSNSSAVRLPVKKRIGFSFSHFACRQSAHPEGGAELRSLESPVRDISI